MVVALLAVLATAVTPACAPSSEPEPDRPIVLDGWQAVGLPGGMTPSTVQVIGDALVVGGFVGSGVDRTPALARGAVGSRDPDLASVPLTPATPYGKVADLVSVTGNGSQLVALGAARGGAHANFRWTVWTGSASRLVDRPQAFETFGGQEAGGLLDAGWDRQGPLIVGTWQGRRGLDGALWRPTGERWVRQPAPAALVNGATRQVAPRTADTQADQTVVINGSVIDLADGVRQSAATWRGSGADWRLSTLPDPGERSEAWSTACATAGGDDGCWTVGSRDGVVAVWSGSARTSVPALTVDDRDTGAVVLRDNKVVTVVSSSGQGRLLVGDDNAWQAYVAPDGAVRAAVLTGAQLYVVSGTDDAARLWSRDLSDVLTR